MPMASVAAGRVREMRFMISPILCAWSMNVQSMDEGLMGESYVVAWLADEVEERSCPGGRALLEVARDG